MISRRRRCAAGSRALPSMSARVYAHLARDLQQGSRTAPGLEHALHNARLIETVQRAAQRGERQRIAG